MSAAVSKVVMRALEVQPRQRFQSGSDFAAAFRAATAGVLLQQSDEARQKGGDQPRPEGKWLDYWRYVVVPLVVGVIGAAAAWCSRR